MAAAPSPSSSWLPRWARWRAPKRSIVFMTFFGEEHACSDRDTTRGIPPSAGANGGGISPGATEPHGFDEGPKWATGNFTGFDFFRSAGNFQKAAGERTGIHVVDDKEHGDDYFGRSDNVNSGSVGVPATPSA